MEFIKDINQDQFIEEVIEKSKTIPIIVDFWAPWCGPCKQLTPTLEKVVNRKNGKILLAKINIDENQSIASQLNIQSIPTVYGFVDGKPIDAFQGAQPESKVEEMINKLIDATPGNEIPIKISEANKLFTDEKFVDALNIFEELIGIDPTNIKILTGILRCYVQLKKFNEAKEMYDSFDESILENEEILKIKQLLDKFTSKKSEDSFEKLIEEVSLNPQDKSLRFKLAESFLSSNETVRGFDELLKIYEEDSNWNDSAAKKKLLEYFDLLGFNDPNVIEARKKLSTIMFK